MKILLILLMVGLFICSCGRENDVEMEEKEAYGTTIRSSSKYGVGTVLR